MIKSESGIGTKLLPPQLNLIEVNNAILALRTVRHANFETASTIYLVNKRENEIANCSGLIGGKPHLC